MTCINVSWDVADGATYYEIYSATSANGKYAKVTTLTGLNYKDMKAY